MDGNISDICIIGAGMAGLACATELKEAGHSVCLIDKGRGPGGRMASRRADVAGQVVSFDHGAQYFTARDEGFRKQVDSWNALGVVAPWPEAGEDAWVGTPGMNGPIRAMAQHLPVEWSRRAETVTRNAAGWQIDSESGTIRAATLLLAIPAEQAADLLQGAAPRLAATAGGVTSEPCWTAMAAFAKPLDLPDSIRSNDGPIAWAARNSAKPGRTGTECWVIHASPAHSREIIDRPKHEVASLLVDDFFEQTGAKPAAPVHLAAHRWLYAMPQTVEGEAARFDAEARIGLAGDYLHSPRVEGAWLSGKALAHKMLGAV
ncbi:MAG: FAD-dependent oxidoreductase [Erythrobacter sp.]